MSVVERARSSWGSRRASISAGERDRVDGRAMAPLSLGHGCADMCQGAVPALLPTLIAARSLSIGAATALVAFATIGSSFVQPVFGIWSDRLSVPLLAPLGVLMAGLGLGAVGLCHSYVALAIALAVSGLGVALFHPEGARMAGIVGRGSARGMGYFSVGGNVGFALGPAAVLLVFALGGLDASPWLALPGVIAAVVLTLGVRRLGRVQANGPGLARTGRRAAAAVGTSSAVPAAQWGPFSRLAGAATARTAAFFALQAFIPIYLIDDLHRSHTLAAVAVIVMLGVRRGRHPGRQSLRRPLRAAAGADLGDAAPDGLAGVDTRRRGDHAVRGARRRRADDRRTVRDHRRDGAAIPARTRRPRLRNHARARDRPRRPARHRTRAQSPT